jgi:Dolichyl-phosphate-mannose-protein mannosyltransferase
MMKNFLGNNRFFTFLYVFIGCAALIIQFFLELKYANPFAATWDQVDFSLALSRYDLLAMQPHFPGYPYFILGGMMIHTIIDNPAKALSTFNVLAMLSATIPIFLLLKKYLKNSIAWLVTVLTQSSSYVMLISTQPMSEGAALAALCWFLWAVQFAKDRRKWYHQLLPVFFFSILLGIRLSYLPFGAAIIFLWYEDWKKHRKIGRILVFVSATLIFQFVWIGAVMMTEGSIKGFIKLAVAFTHGHFHDWGGAVTAENESFFNRLYTFVFYNIVWTGIASQNVWLLFIYIMMFLLAMKRGISFFFPKWLAATGMIYLMWAFIAQNVDKPRHIVPLVFILLIFGWVRYFSQEPSNVKLFLAIIVLIVQVIVGSTNVYKQAVQLPATYQLAYDLQKEEVPFVLYTWEETRVMQFLDVDFLHKRVYHFDVFLQDIKNYKGAKIYLTDHVVKGFKAQGESLEGRIRKIKTYTSNELSDPVYGTITLYEWID